MSKKMPAKAISPIVSFSPEHELAWLTIYFYDLIPYKAPLEVNEPALQKLDIGFFQGLFLLRLLFEVLLEEGVEELFCMSNSRVHFECSFKVVLYQTNFQGT
jgi:hypothetical protein